MLLGKRLFGALAALMVLFCVSANAADYTVEMGTTPGGSATLTATVGTATDFCVSVDPQPASSYEIKWGGGVASDYYTATGNYSAFTKTYDSAGSYSVILSVKNSSNVYSQVYGANIDVAGVANGYEALKMVSPVSGASLSTANSSVSFATKWRMSSVPSALSSMTPMVWVRPTTGLARTGANTISWSGAAVFTTGGSYSNGSLVSNTTFGITGGVVDLSKDEYTLTVSASTTTGEISARLAPNTASDFSAMAGSTVYLATTWGVYGGVNASYGDQNVDYGSGSAFNFSFVAPQTPAIATAVADPAAPTGAEVNAVVTALSGAGVGAGVPFTCASFTSANAAETILGGWTSQASTMSVTYYTAAANYNMANGQAVNIGSILTGAPTVDAVFVFEPEPGLIIFRLFDYAGTGANTEVHTLASGYLSVPMTYGTAGATFTHYNSSNQADGYNLTAGGTPDISDAYNCGTFIDNSDGTYNISINRLGGPGVAGGSSSSDGSSGCEVASNGSAWALLPVALVLSALALLALRRKEA